ncbi:MAG: hypothetical protein PHV82_00245 [Victivallaceae bacterium]|nr:hypothetical protein [Victivallaceae bacterium]
MDNDLTFISEWLDRAFKLALTWSDDNGRMCDRYETVYSENFAPACWSVVAAGLYVLTDERKYLEWTMKWVRRSSQLMKENPGLRDYTLGYASMIFPVLREKSGGKALKEIQEDYASSYTGERPVSGDMHIAALQLIGDLYCSPHREDAALERSKKILATIERRINELGFLTDDNAHGNSIPHMLLTCSILSVILLDDDSQIKDRALSVIEKVNKWLRRFNGNNYLPVQANRSYNQMYTYPLTALLNFIENGHDSIDRVRFLWEFQTRFVDEKGILRITPNYLSSYAGAGVETNYNRLDNDLGAGAVGWIILLLLASKNRQDKKHEIKKENGITADNDAGFAVFHKDNQRVFFALRNHKWQYHLPLQPISICFSQHLNPFCGAKRSGTNNPYTKLIADLSKVNPLLEPYWGIFGKTADNGYVIMNGEATACPDGGYRLDGCGIEMEFRVKAENGSLFLHYRYTVTGAESAFYAVPILLWDGKNELHYDIAGNSAKLRWLGREYNLSVSTPDIWALSMERSYSTGYGLNGHFIIPVNRQGELTITFAETANNGDQ